ncbi:DUF6531 domain-containing protein [Paraburkholderia sp.]|uniref:DUF6531 domain-containing protein n=1 Tax=Paraburkholderia sp. TaxID=1926495 RepID=UPI002D330AE0|nr:DUF6531 domain-containing protein [Paraburkholderia sp.]HZZ02875.1 DUF6531 domain-containing protein [Paraburkholderia sp.]
MIRLLTAFMLLVVAFGANADDYCYSLYAKSGAKPGTTSCRNDVFGNTPGGMGNYACINNISLIDQWCATPATDEPEQSCPVADPVYPGSGAVTLTEADFVSGDDIPMQFTRTYRSKPLGVSATAMGPVWFHSWQRNLGLANANSGSTSKVLAYRENGEPVTFNWSAGTWRTAGFTGLSLSQSGSGWTLTDLRTETVETYSAQGVLFSESTKTGFVRTLNYDGSGLLTTITQHAAGTDANKNITLRLDYDDKHRLSRLNDPLGGMTQYGYDANGNLVSVTWPDGYAHRYVYDDSRFKNALTGEIDEAGSRIATWSYDSQGRAMAVSHPESSRNAQFTYGTGTTSVTDSKRTTTLNFSSVVGMLRPTSSSSADGATVLAWDASGNLLKDTGASGNTEYAYDDAGRPVRITVNGVSGTSITTIRYADTTSLHPATIASPGVIQSFVYDAQGNATGMSETPTADSTGASGFDAAKSGGATRAYGMVYDVFNRLTFVQMHEGGALIGQWVVTHDASGNVFSIYPTDEYVASEIIARDASHRPLRGFNPTGDFNLRYDRRGRIDLFTFNEYASPANGGVRRVLKVRFSFSPDSQVVSRTGTVATNGSILDLNDGSDIAISSDEIDQWIDNYNFGESPVGPPANLQGARQLLRAGSSVGMGTVCRSCHFSAGLYDGLLVRGIVFVWRLAQNPAVRYGIGQGVQKARDTIERIKEQCKPVVKDTSEVNFGRNDNQIYHTFRYLDAKGIPRQPVINAIIKDVAENSGAKMAVGDGETFYITVNGVQIGYSAYRQSADVVRVGSIRPPR